MFINGTRYLSLLYQYQPRCRQPTRTARLRESPITLPATGSGHPYSCIRAITPLTHPGSTPAIGSAYLAKHLTNHFCTSQHPISRPLIIAATGLSDTSKRAESCAKLVTIADTSVIPSRLAVEVCTDRLAR